MLQNLYKSQWLQPAIGAKQLGYASISTTIVYSDVMSEDTEAAVNNLN